MHFVEKYFQNLSLKLLQMEQKDPLVYEDIEPMPKDGLLEAVPAVCCSGTRSLSHVTKRPRLKALKKS